MKTIYQVQNKAGNPASTETNPSAIFFSEADANSYKEYLHEECDINMKELNVVKLSDQEQNDILKMESIGRDIKTLFNLELKPGKEATVNTYYGKKTLLGLGRTVYQILTSNNH